MLGKVVGDHLGIKVHQFPEKSFSRKRKIQGVKKMKNRKRTSAVL